jgi:HSP20 family protein
MYNNPAALRPSRAINTMLTELLRDTLPAAPRTTTVFNPATDVVESAEGFELHLALPGLKKEAIKIEFLDGQLVVSGERANPFAAAKEAASSATEATETEDTDNKPVVMEDPNAEARAPKFRRLETAYGSFSRSFRLPDTVNVKAIGAELTDGILRITLPFDTEKTTKQHIEIR